MKNQEIKKEEPSAKLNEVMNLIIGLSAEDIKKLQEIILLDVIKELKQKTK